METDLTNVQVQSFQKHYTKNSTVELLEGAKKNEIVEIAKARGMNLKQNRDLAGFKSVYTIADIVDANGQRIPKKKLLKVLPTLIGKPVNINHQRSYVVGHYIDSKFIEKENKVIAYGVFYKSNFAQEWETAKAFFLSKQLGMSSEIWSPKKSWKYLEDGSFVLGQMELAGGALVYPPDVPAVRGADVLAIAKKNIDDNGDADLIYATKYKDDDIMTSEEATPEVETPKEEKPQAVVIEVRKTKCSLCGEEFVPLPGNNKCSKCFAIVDEKGVMVYPPQIMKFSMRCLNPHCGVKNWLLLKQTEKNAVVRCLSCAKEYDLTFAEENPDQASTLLKFIYSTDAVCPQCNTSKPVVGVSSVNERTVKCDKCGMEFPIEIGKSEKQKIASAVEIIVEKNPTDNPEGGNVMTKKKDEKLEEVVESTEEQVEPVTEEVTVEEVPTAEVVVEEPVVETPVVEEPVVEEPVVEEPVVEETPTEPVVEETPTEQVPVEEVVVEPVVEEEPEAEAAKVLFVEKYRTRIKSLLETIRKERKTNAEALTTSTEQVTFYKENGKILLERRTELGTAANKLTDEQLMDNDKYELAKSVKESVDDDAEVIAANKEDIATAVVSDTHLNLDELDKAAQAITKRAFGHINDKK